MIIFFTHRTSKIIPRIFCRRFRHCGIIENNILYHIVNYRIHTLKLKKSDLQKLQDNGFVFIELRTQNLELRTQKYLSCVSFVKDVCGIKKRRIITPLQLYKQVAELRVKS